MAMSEQSLAALLEESGLMERAVKVDESVYHLHWGSAEVVIGITEHALAVFAPMFKELPAGQEGLFCLRLLQLNGAMGGVASFAIQPDGWVVLHTGRSVKGMDAQELQAIVTAVGELADYYDDQLYHAFFAPPVSELEAEDLGEQDEDAAEAETPAAPAGEPH